MAVFQALDRIGSGTTVDLLARLAPHPQPVAMAEQPPTGGRLTLSWVIDSQTGRPVGSWMLR